MKGRGTGALLNGIGPEEEQALEQGVVEEVHESAGKKGAGSVAAGRVHVAGQKPGPQGQADQAHVFRAGIGQPALGVRLGGLLANLAFGRQSRKKGARDMTSQATKKRMPSAAVMTRTMAAGKRQKKKPCLP